MNLNWTFESISWLECLSTNTILTQIISSCELPDLIHYRTRDQIRFITFYFSICILSSSQENLDFRIIIVASCLPCSSLQRSWHWQSEKNRPKLNWTSNYSNDRTINLNQIPSNEQMTTCHILMFISHFSFSRDDPLQHVMKLRGTL